MKASKTFGPTTLPKKTSSSRKTNISISFVGSGNVATHLAHSFHNAGCSIVQVWSRSIDHAVALSSQVGAQAIGDITAMNTAVDFCIIAVSDDALPIVVQHLHLPDSIVVHTSGTGDIELLHSVSPHYGVLWSPISFIRDEKLDYTLLPYCIEGSDETTTIAIEQIVKHIGTNIYRVGTAQRRYAHLSAAIANNFGNALLAEVQHLAIKWNIPFEILQPIILQTAKKAGSRNLWQQQTGPAVRRDTSTLDAHRTMLQDQPELLELYNAFTRLIMQKTMEP